MRIKIKDVWSMLDFCKGQGMSKEHIKRNQCTAYKDCPQEKAMATMVFNFAVRAGFVIRCPVISSHYMANPKVYEVLNHTHNI